MAYKRQPLGAHYWQFSLLVVELPVCIYDYLVQNRKKVGAGMLGFLPRLYAQEGER